MKTSKPIKVIMTIITFVVVTILPTTVKAYSLTHINPSNKLNIEKVKFNEKSDNLLNVEELKIKPINKHLHASVNTVKIKIDVNELKQIKIARRKALELQKQKEEEERKKQEEAKAAEEKAKADEAIKNITYTSGNTLSYDELVAKLNRILNSDLAGKGEAFAKYAASLGIDPYLAVAIVLHETGCQWNCSTLLKQCNNVGGMKGAPGCNGGAYKSFSTLDEGIEAFMNNLYNNYISKGLTTPETIGPKYAASQAWAANIRKYMSKIEAI